MRTKRGTPPEWTTMFVTRAPTSTIASVSTSMSVRLPTDRRTANEVRSTIAGVRPARWAQLTLASTVSRDAATSRPRTRLWPLTCTVSSGWKSSTACSTGIGRKSCTWNGSAFFSSASGICGSSTWRTITRWFATPSTTFLWLKRVAAHSCLMASATASPLMTSPSRTAPSGTATCPNLSSVMPSLPNDSSAARTPEVPMSRPMAVRPATVTPLPARRAGSGAGRDSPSLAVQTEIGTWGSALEPFRVRGARERVNPPFGAVSGLAPPGQGRRRDRHREGLADDEGLVPRGALSLAVDLAFQDMRGHGDRSLGVDDPVVRDAHLGVDAELVGEIPAPGGAGQDFDREDDLPGIEHAQLVDVDILSLIHISEPTRRTPISYAV